MKNHVMKCLRVNEPTRDTKSPRRDNNRLRGSEGERKKREVIAEYTIGIGN